MSDFITAHNDIIAIAFTVFVIAVLLVFVEQIIGVPSDE
jgi:hypothetical protein